MDILPAIDLRGGKVVRLARGDYDSQTTYSDDPAGVAAAFLAAGAEWIHVVDLDAARTGRLANIGAVRDICRAVGGRATVQFGGGIRDSQAMDTMLDAGAGRLVIGSAALTNWTWFERVARDEALAGKIALGLDERRGRLAAAGWTEQVRQTAADLARRVAGWPLGAIVYTDICRDGMLTGVNVEATADLIAATDIPVIASGGVRSLDDVAACKRIGCAGAIIGKAYYESKVDLSAACALARGGGPEDATPKKN